MKPPLLLLFLIAIYLPAAQVTPALAAKNGGKTERSIRTATMIRDGTIVLPLSALAPGGMKGEGTPDLPAESPTISRNPRPHRSDSPGQTVPVKPWPD